MDGKLEQWVVRLLVTKILYIGDKTQGDGVVVGSHCTKSTPAAMVGGFGT